MPVLSWLAISHSLSREFSCLDRRCLQLDPLLFGLPLDVSPDLSASVSMTGWVSG
jgi:hypothetical protein